eukprot:tig00000113_g5663.t1
MFPSVDAYFDQRIAKDLKISVPPPTLDKAPAWIKRYAEKHNEAPPESGELVCNKTLCRAYMWIARFIHERSKESSGKFIARSVRHYLVSPEELEVFINRLVRAHRLLKEWRLNAAMAKATLRMQGRIAFDDINLDTSNPEDTLGEDREKQVAIFSNAQSSALQKAAAKAKALEAELKAAFSQASIHCSRPGFLIRIPTQIKRVEEEKQQMAQKMAELSGTSKLPDSLRFDEFLYLLRQEVLLQWEARSDLSQLRLFSAFLGTAVNQEVVAKEVKRALLDFSLECFDFVDVDEEATSYIPRPIDTREICGLSVDPAIGYAPIVDYIVSRWAEIRVWQWPLIFVEPDVAGDPGRVTKLWDQVRSTWHLQPVTAANNRAIRNSAR